MQQLVQRDNKINLGHLGYYYNYLRWCERQLRLLDDDFSVKEDIREVLEAKLLITNQIHVLVGEQ
tara:strand:+ start:389 stop:583 length:195 start_codon:yes stop_codon:yes gene_type:complete